MTIDVLSVLVGVIVGFIVRVFLIVNDYRQYPTYPHGYVIHLSLGFIASALGAVAVPAILDEEYTAITFLALAAQQFREVRNMERESLNRLDNMELVPRGSSYIEGIAMIFESRNYIVIMTSFITSLVVIKTESWLLGTVVGLGAIVINRLFLRGKYINDIAKVSKGNLRFEGPNLFIDNIYMMNVGLEGNREVILNKGVGVVLTPKSINSKVILSNLGQRQTIIYDASIMLGIYRDFGDAALTPLAKRNLDSGELGVLLLPQETNEQKIIKTIERVPVLENAVRKPV